MSKGVRSFVKGIVVLLCLGWMAWAGWNEFAALPESDVQTHLSPAVKEKLRECEGSFKKRYECKEAIVIKTHRDTFYFMALRIGFVVVPPILLGIAFAVLFPKRLIIQHRVVDEDPDAWKRRAQRQTQVPFNRSGDDAS